MSDEHVDAEPRDAPESGGALAASLLHAPVAGDDRPDRRWAYPWWGMVLVSLFIAYHVSVLLVHNLPGGGLSKGLHSWFNKHLQMRQYLHATGNVQSWAMFAPNPHRSNIFMRVLVVDADGETWDMKHDIYGRRTYPYLFYDRMGKVNRRLVDQKGYRRLYAAWVCRDWERTHEGEPPREVQFVKMWSKIPHPRQLQADPPLPVRLFMPETWKDWKPMRMGFDPMELYLAKREEETIRCATTREAQLPNFLRRRYGLPEVPEGTFRALDLRTWWGRKEVRERQAAARRAVPSQPPRARGGDE